MKKVISIVILISLILTLIPAAALAAEENIIPDENFRKYLVECGADSNGDGNISKDEAGSFTEAIAPQRRGICSIEGIQYFDQVTYVDIAYNNVTDISPLLGMDSLNNAGLFNNRINCSVLQTIDSDVMAIIKELETKGVQVYSYEEQQILEETPNFSAGTPVYKILVVAVTSVDATAEKSIDGGDYLHYSYTMSDVDREICREYTRLFEIAMERISGYAVNFDVDLYFTENTLTEIPFRGIGEGENGDLRYDYAIFGSGIPEIQGMIADYDTILTLAYVDSNLHSMSGLGHFNSSIDRGEATVFYDVVCGRYQISGYTAEKFLAELKSNYFEIGVDTMIHETTHSIEQFAEVCQYNIWEYHDLLRQAKDEERLKNMGEYLTGKVNPENTEQTGIPDFIYENPPTEYSAMHVWGEWEYQSSATCIYQGYRSRVCSHCGKIEDEFIPATGHNFVNHCCTVCGKEEEQVCGFADVYESNYFASPVEWAYNHDPQITNGTDDSHFSPDTVCTREQVVTFLWRAFGCPEPKTTECGFLDVEKGTYYYNAVLWAVENGITDGIDTSIFGVGDYVTRAQTVTFLWRAAGKPVPKGTSCSFLDVEAGSYYYNAVLWAVESGITNGTDTSVFGSNDFCTRAQVVTFLFRYLEG